MNKLLLIVISIVLLTASSASAGEVDILFKKGQTFARQQKLDFAYMQFRDIVEQFPRSDLQEKSLFAIGEYFYIISVFPEASRAFTKFIETYPDSKLKIFALGYLYNIAAKDQDAELMEKLKTEIIIQQQVALIFRNAKEYTFTSPLYRRYRGRVQIDKITITCDGQNIAEISY